MFSSIFCNLAKNSALFAAVGGCELSVNKTLLEKAGSTGVMYCTSVARIGNVILVFFLEFVIQLIGTKATTQTIMLRYTHALGNSTSHPKNTILGISCTKLSPGTPGV